MFNEGNPPLYGDFSVVRRLLPITFIPWWAPKIIFFTWTDTALDIYIFKKRCQFSAESLHAYRDCRDILLVLWNWICYLTHYQERLASSCRHSVQFRNGSVSLFTNRKSFCATVAAQKYSQQHGRQNQSLSSPLCYRGRCCQNNH